MKGMFSEVQTEPVQVGRIRDDVIALDLGIEEIYAALGIGITTVDEVSRNDIEPVGL